MATLTLTNLGATPTGVEITVVGDPGVPYDVPFFRLTEAGVIEPTGLSVLDFGSFTGTLLLPPGFYFGFLNNVTTGNTEKLAFVTVTNGLDAVLTRIRAAVKARILLIGLDGLSGGVVEQWTPDDNNVEYPCVILTHENTSQTNSQKVVGTSDVGHPVRVMICDRVSRYDHAEMPKYDLWRQQIWRAFDNQRLLGVAESLHCVIEPDLITDAQGVKYELMVSQLVIRVTTREPATGA